MKRFLTFLLGFFSFFLHNFADANAKKSIARCFYRIEDIEWDLKKWKSTLTKEEAAKKAFKQMQKMYKKMKLLPENDTLRIELEKFSEKWLSEEKLRLFYLGNEKNGNFSVDCAHFRWILPERKVWRFHLFRLYRP
jgi:hypothetical protein